MQTGSRVRLRATPAKAGTVNRLTAKQADVSWDDGSTGRVAQTALEAKRGALVGTRAPVYTDPGEASFERRLASVLCARLTELGMSRNQLATRAGVSRSTLTRILNGSSTRIWIDTAEALARAVGVSPSAFWLAT